MPSKRMDAEIKMKNAEDRIKSIFFLLFLGMTVNVHALNIDATCIDDNVEVSISGQNLFFLESGNEVKITDINDKFITLNYKGQRGTAEAIHFKIKYQPGLKLLSELLNSMEYQGNIRVYDENDCSTSSDIRMFLANSFGISFADVLRNEIFARYGDIFKNKFYQDLFNQTNWYKVNPNFNVLELNGFEQTNIKWLKSFSGSTNQQPPIVSDGLVAYYPFNGNANDESGNNNNGNVYGAGLTQDRFNTPSKAYLFDGIDDYILVPDSPVLDLTNAVSISVWIRPDVTPQAEGAAVVCKGYGAGDEVYCLDMTTYANTTLRFLVWVGGSYRQNMTTNWLTSDKVGQWINIVAIFDGKARKSWLFENGRKISTEKGYHLTLDCNNHPLSIGSREQHRGSNYNLCFKGAIDDVRIYNRVLNLDEIKALAVEK